MKWTHFHRMRKYARKKRMALKARNPRLMTYIQLYWNYAGHLYEPEEAW